MAVCQAETRRVLGPGAAAEDAAQEAAIRAWRCWPQCRASDPGPWLRRIAYRAALREAAGGSCATLDDVLEVEEVMRSPGADAWATEHALRAAIAELDSGDRMLLYLHYWQQRPINEVSRAYCIPEGTLKVRLHRLRKRLREMLEGDLT